ncbi:hypothetical protein [Thiocapsa sp.]|uniref:hypothetical protein n=1 Tax=Thiocapsa sp. TaxID=2024551 RepID=UPI0025F06C30|nr:hypothetical protein [Thiocapsa sp.]
MSTLRQWKTPYTRAEFLALLTRVGSSIVGTDSRLSDAREPTAHADDHLPDGLDPLTAVKLGGVAGDDPRLSDAREPLPHQHALPYDIEFFISGALVVDEVVGLFLVNRALSIAVEEDSSAKCLTASTGTVVYTLKQNGTSIGAATFSASNTTGAVDFTTVPVALAKGDVLSVTSQSDADATIANVIIAVATEFKSV